MPRQTPPEQRRLFVERHQNGATYAAIAHECQVSMECVRYWCRRIRKGGSEKTVYHRNPVDRCRPSRGFCAM